MPDRRPELLDALNALYERHSGAADSPFPIRNLEPTPELVK